MLLCLQDSIELLSRSRLQLPCEFYTTIICYTHLVTGDLKLDCLWYDSETELIVVCVSSTIIKDVPCSPVYNKLALEQIARRMHNDKISAMTVGSNIFYQLTEYYRNFKK